MRGLIFCEKSNQCSIIAQSNKIQIQTQNADTVQNTGTDAEHRHRDSPISPELCLEPPCALQGLLIILPTNPDVHLAPWWSLTPQHAHEASCRRRDKHSTRHTECPCRRRRCDACVAAGRDDEVWQGYSGGRRPRLRRYGRGTGARERCVCRDGLRIELVWRACSGGRLRVYKGADCLVCKVGDASALYGEP
jgi:hypothetical protein